MNHYKKIKFKLKFKQIKMVLFCVLQYKMVNYGAIFFN